MDSLSVCLFCLCLCVMDVSFSLVLKRFEVIYLDIKITRVYETGEEFTTTTTATQKLPQILIFTQSDLQLHL